MAQRFNATLERHRPDLPVYLIVPNSVVDEFGKQDTFTADVTVNKRDIGRRSIKPWGDGRWFMELTKAQCARLGVVTGDSLEVTAVPAPETHSELETRIAEAVVRDAWQRLSPSRRRMIAENIFDAKKPATRAKRIARVIAALVAQQK